LQESKTSSINFGPHFKLEKKDPPLSLGHASILANLASHQISTIPISKSVIDPHFTIKSLLEEIHSHDDEESDVAFGAFVWNEHFVQTMTKELKNHKFKGKIILQLVWT